MKIEIISTTWFTELGNPKPIGIVHINNGFENKAYIGNGIGKNLEDDIQQIISNGAYFPLESLKHLPMIPYNASITNNAITI